MRKHRQRGVTNVCQSTENKIAIGELMKANVRVKNIKTDWIKDSRYEKDLNKTFTNDIATIKLTNYLLSLIKNK